VRNYPKILAICLNFSLLFQVSVLSSARAGIETQSTWHLHKAMQKFSGVYRPTEALINPEFINSPNQVLLDGTVRLEIFSEIHNGTPTLFIRYVDTSGRPIVPSPTDEYSGKPTVAFMKPFKITEVSKFEFGEDFLIVRHIQKEQLYSRFLRSSIWFPRPLKSLELVFSLVEGKEKELKILTYGSEGLVLKRVSDAPYRVETLVCNKLLR
jgi:hypothetical protein